jgi:hypothetical protein
VQFSLPAHGPPGLEGSVYWVDFQGARIISLNSNERQEEQIGWLERVLGENPNKWTIVTFHHPIYSAAGDRDNPEIRRFWQPVLDKYKVDLVLQGHDHTYARSGLMTSQNVPTGGEFFNGDTGTVYVVSVSGPKMYDSKRSGWMMRAGEDTQLYQIISIDGDSLHYEAKTATGRRYDSFDLLKRVGQANLLVERKPESPERHRPETLPSSRLKEWLEKRKTPSSEGAIKPESERVRESPKAVEANKPRS